MKFIRILKILLQILFKPAKVINPIYIQVEPTNYCNLNCNFCQRDKMKAKLEHMSLEKFEEILRDYKPTHITLSGDGEPLLHPQIDKLIAMTKLSGAKVNLATNGTLLFKYAEKVKGLDLLKISIDAAYPKTYKKIRNVDLFNQI